MSAPMLQVQDLSRRFAGLLAVKNVSFTLGRGEAGLHPYLLNMAF